MPHHAGLVLGISMQNTDPALGADFRDGAVAESALQFKEQRQSSFADDTPMSQCTRSDVDPGILRMALKSVALLCAAFALCSAVSGVPLLAVAVTNVHRDLFLAAVFLMVGAAMSFLAPSLIERVLVRHHLRGRLANHWSDANVAKTFVSVENAETYNKFKLLAEDVGVLLCRTESGFVTLEGIGFRYFVLTGDVVELSLHPNGRAVLLTYKIGATILRLAIVPRGIVMERKRQQMGGINRELIELMTGALTPGDNKENSLPGPERA